ncbi:MAG TPA: glutamate--cysteine ligase [Cellvibrionaceae bacterium]
MSRLNSHLAALASSGATDSLCGILRGLEKESLRVTPEGHLAQTPHAPTLGSALTHPHITTDFSEALLEFITQPTTSIRALLTELDDIHRYTYSQLGDELLWPGSMPCVLGKDDDIPVARYGSANSAAMKTIYRLGLGHRYGRRMQTIAGVHYNFSLPDSFWQALQQQEIDSRPLQVYKTEKYFALIRNFRRNFWLLLHLYGAAPAVCKSFVGDREHSLEPLPGNSNTLHLPYATSLRMGDLGYQSDAQQSLIVCYNNLDSYLKTLCSAITRPLPAYQAIGLKDAAGNYQQLNTSLLQIENEFYSTIRPKRTTRSGQTALDALSTGGVEYVEVRCVDLNPFEPLGVNAEQLHYLDAFLLYCLLQDSPPTTHPEYLELQENQKRVVQNGRDPALRLQQGGREVPLGVWAADIQQGVAACAQWLDQAFGTGDYGAAVTAQDDKLAGRSSTPAEQLLTQMQTSGKGYYQTMLEQAQAHRDYFAHRPRDAELQQLFTTLAETSLAEQRDIEAADSLDFNSYLARYYAQYANCGCSESAAATVE